MITKGASFAVPGGTAAATGDVGPWSSLGSHYYLASFILTSHGLLNVCSYAHGKFTEYVQGVQFDTTIPLDGKVFMVTGSNTGLGFHTAKELVLMGATVVMACRTPSKAQDARTQILTSTECVLAKIAPSKILVLPLDLNSFDSVRKCAEAFLELKIPLHGLINNAGLMNAERYTTADGHEVVMCANHLSHFLLSNLCYRGEVDACYGRIITLSSALHKVPQAFNFNDVMSENDYSLFGTYAQSKLANVLFTTEMQRRIDLTSEKAHADVNTESSLNKHCIMVVANSVHPGCVRTEVTRGMSPLVRFGNDMAAPFMRWLQKTPREGCFSSVHAATSLEARGGGYYFHCERVAQGTGVNDTDAKRLWEVSEAYCETKFL
eukprot:GSChrysophyteH2.ASY1.ANO1.641.1 assembled CDS